ncbi:MAG: type II toxin-antitoxin system Phd/YefM family antitoxin [Anaerolineae bacterium]
MPKTIEIKEAKAQYGLSLDEAQLAEGPLIVERQGKPIAAIIPFAEYERYRTWREKEKRAAVRQAQLQKFEQERAAYLRLKPQLLQTHRGQFVAIHESKVVDTDEENRELVKRVIERYGNEPVYIQLVAEELRTFEIPSPEIEFYASL